MSERHGLDGLADELESIDGAAERHQDVPRVADEEALIDETPHEADLDLRRLQILARYDDHQRRKQICNAPTAGLVKAL